MIWVFVALGGTFGALARYGLDRAVVNAIGPTVWGTFIINISGSFLLGLIAVLSIEKAQWPEGVRILVAVGFLGSYTTFSTLTLASAQLIDGGDVTRGLLNLLGSIGVGLLAAYLGIVVGRAL